jgi:hypothetical protein
MPFQFDGFSTPNGTYVPDEVFDILAPELTEAELRVLLYIIRRTFGFKKNADTISLKQMIDGITKRDGTVLDRGTGMSKSANWRGIKGLLDKGIIISQRNSSSEKGDLPTTYSLRFRTGTDGFNGSPETNSSNGGEQSNNSRYSHSAQGVPEMKHPVFSKRTPPGSLKEHPRVLQKNTQETVVQETDFNLSNNRKQHAAENSNKTETRTGASRPQLNLLAAHSPGCEAIGAVLSRIQQPVLSVPVEEARNAIRAYLRDISPKFNDQAPLESSVSRALHLYERSNLPLGEFLSRLLEVSSSVRERQPKVKKRANGGRATMPYYFACLEDRLGLRPAPKTKVTTKLPVQVPGQVIQVDTQPTTQFSPLRTSSPGGEQGGNYLPPHTHSFAHPSAQLGFAQSGQSSVDARSASAAPS